MAAEELRLARPREGVHEALFNAGMTPAKPSVALGLAAVLLGVGGRLGDNRDWPEIDVWAERIAHGLQAPTPGR
jgi:hypothetical protein